jgi:pyruvate,water dikinase
VAPDRYRVSRTGRILSRRGGMKDIAIAARPGGGTIEVEVAPARVTALCLDDAQLLALADLATRCEAVLGGQPCLEWAFAGRQLFLVGRSAITA